jgi:hypothetical protein
MIGLRVASLVVLAIWVGGLAALGFVAAPAIFSTLEAADPAGGRVLAAAVFGSVFTKFQYTTLALAAIFVALLVLRALLGPRPVRMAWRVWTVAAMIAFSAAALFYISPRIEQLRREAGGSMSALPDTDARKTEFGRLHGLSNVLMMLTLVAGVGLIWMESKDG